MHLKSIFGGAVSKYRRATESLAAAGASGRPASTLSEMAATGVRI